MKFKHYLYAVAMMATLGTVATACDDEDHNNTEIGTGGDEGTGGGDGARAPTSQPPAKCQASGEAGSTVNVTGHITVPEGQKPHHRRGVTVVFTTEGVGTNHVPVEFIVRRQPLLQGHGRAQS